MLLLVFSVYMALVDGLTCQNNPKITEDQKGRDAYLEWVLILPSLVLCHNDPARWLAQSLCGLQTLLNHVESAAHQLQTSPYRFISVNVFCVHMVNLINQGLDNLHLDNERWGPFLSQSGLLQGCIRVVHCTITCEKQKGPATLVTTAGREFVGEESKRWCAPPIG